MTPEKQRIAIAEACGWKWAKWGEPPGEANRFLLPPSFEYKGSMLPCEKPSHGTPVSLTDIPDYLNDLNAMHEAEKVLTVRQSKDYWDELASMVPRNQGMFGVLHTSASFRAAAFLRTIGKWDETP